MGYKSFACMNIAVIGNEKTSAVLAHGLALAGHNISIGIKEDQEILFDYLVDEFENIAITTVDLAAIDADVIIMATAQQDVREMSYLLDDVRSKMIIDTTLVRTTQTGEYVNSLHAIKAITGAKHIAKCFNAAGFDPLGDAPGGEQAIQMFVAGDDLKAKAMARIVARDLGFSDCHDFGGEESVSLLDEMALCYHHLALRKSRGERISIRISRL